MTVPNPFFWLAPAHRRPALVFLGSATVAMLGALQVLNAPLRTDAAPGGILSFEFVSSLAEAGRLLASWDTSLKIRAGISLGLDYLFLVCYGPFLALAIGQAAQRWVASRPAWYSLGLLLAWLQLLAALLDGLENLALIQLLLGAQEAFWPPLSYWCASFKFIFLGLGLLYLGFTGVHFVKGRR